MLGSIACVKRCSSWYFLSPPDQFNVLQIDFSIDNLEEHKRGEVLRVHHYCSFNTIHSALTAIRSNMQTSILHSAIFFLKSSLDPFLIMMKKIKELSVWPEWGMDETVKVKHEQKKSQDSFLMNYCLWIVNLDSILFVVCFPNSYCVTTLLCIVPFQIAKMHPGLSRGSEMLLSFIFTFYFSHWINWMLPPASCENIACAREYKPMNT